MKNSIEQFNNLHKKKSKSKSTKVRIALIITAITLLGLTSAVVRHKAINGEVVIIVGQITKINPTTIYYEVPFEGILINGVFNDTHSNRKIGDLVIVQISKKSPKHNLALNRFEKVNSSRRYGEIINNIEPYKLKWWQNW